MNVLRALICWTILIATAAGLSGASYYVTQSGAGSKNGTSLGNAWSVANYNASGSPTGGDTVFFSGTITSQPVIATGGTSSSVVLTLDFSAATISVAADPEININGQNYVTLLGGTFSLDSGGHWLVNCGGAGVQAHDISVENFTYTGPPGDSGTSGFFDIRRCSNILVQGNTMDNVESGVLSEGGSISNITIRNNWIRTSTNTIDQSDIVFISDAANVLIEGNKFIQQTPGANSGRHNDGIQTYKSGSSAAINPTNWTIRYNWIELAVTTGSGDNSWTMIENMAGQPALKEYSNVFVGTGASLPGGNGNAIHFGTNASDTYYIYNNTWYKHALPINATNFGNSNDGPGTMYIRNNVGGADATCSCTMLNWTFSAGAAWNKNFFLNWDGCSSTNTGSGGSCNTNLLFTSAAANNFSTQSGSPLRNAGDSTIGSEFNQGIAPGATWPNPTLVTRSSGSWDVGAFQQSSGVLVSVGSPGPVTVTAIQ
jgi:hypothetical protein